MLYLSTMDVSPLQPSMAELVVGGLSLLLLVGLTTLVVRFLLRR